MLTHFPRYAHKLNLPDCVFEARSIKEIERIGIDLVLLSVLQPLYQMNNFSQITGKTIFSRTAKKRYVLNTMR